MNYQQISEINNLIIIAFFLIKTENQIQMK